MKDTLTINQLVEMSLEDHNAAIIAARHLEGWRPYMVCDDGQGRTCQTYYKACGETNVELPWMSHKDCLDIINRHTGILKQSFDPGI